MAGYAKKSGEKQIIEKFCVIMPFRSGDGFEKYGILVIKILAVGPRHQFKTDAVRLLHNLKIILKEALSCIERRRLRFS